MDAMAMGQTIAYVGGGFLTEQPLTQPSNMVMRINQITPLSVSLQLDEDGKWKLNVVDRQEALDELFRQYPTAQVSPDLPYAPSRSRCGCGKLYTFETCTNHGEALEIILKCPCCDHERPFLVKFEGGKRAALITDDEGRAMLIQYELVSPHANAVN